MPTTCALPRGYPNGAHSGMTTPPFACWASRPGSATGPFPGVLTWLAFGFLLCFETTQTVGRSKKSWNGTCPGFHPSHL